jgi:hypothetical protein
VTKIKFSRICVVEFRGRANRQTARPRQGRRRRLGCGCRGGRSAPGGACGGPGRPPPWTGAAAASRSRRLARRTAPAASSQVFRAPPSAPPPSSSYLTRPQTRSSLEKPLRLRDREERIPSLQCKTVEYFVS